MFKILLSKLKEALISVLPVTVIILILAATPIVNISGREIGIFCASAVLLILGIGLFNMGADLAMTPMGEHIGAGLTKSKKLTVLLVVCFIMGVLITIAEPDLSVLAEQVSTVMNSTLLIVMVGVGVGLFLLLAVCKIVFKKNLSMLLMFAYLALFMVCAVLLELKGEDGSMFFPLAFDSGGVTTGPITVPFLMALGLGISTTVGGKNSNENSFGLIALCSVGPMIAVLLLSATSKGELTYTLPDYSMSAVTGANFGPEVLRILLDVLKALGLIVVFFFILQFSVLKLPKRKIIQIIIGIVYTFLGLVLFLGAATVGFMPIGFEIGSQVASYNSGIMIALGFVFGAVVVLAEPAVHVLNKQVEDVTDGAVKKREMMIALALGVGLSIGLSMIRVIFGFSLLWYLVPGYIISLGLSFFVPGLYTAIAFDSGGVASGPLTSSFILPMAIGTCSALGGNVLGSAFGVVSMVAMVPLITIQVLGFKAIVSRRMRQKLTERRIFAADDEQIIYFAGDGDEE